MGYSNGEIYAPVSIRDVQNALGSSATDLGTLIRNGNINKWARYKPVIYAGVDKIRDRDIHTSSPDTIFDNKTGLNFPSLISTPSSVAGFSDVQIQYNKPTGGSASPYRLTDFSGYYHYASLPVSISWRSQFQRDTGMACTLIISDSSSGQAGYAITFGDILAEISGGTAFKNKDKRLCLAVYNNNDDTNPIWYFFSEKLSVNAYLGSHTVGVNMDSTSFTNLLTTGNTYHFLVMLVSNHSYLEQTVNGQERWVWGISPSEMASIETGSNAISGMCLAFENGIDRCTRVLQQASVITGLSYYLDILSYDKYGSIQQIGSYNKLCTRVYLPTIFVRKPTSPMGSAEAYQLRARYSQVNTSTMIFVPSDKSGNNYYETASTPSASMAEIALTPWVSIGDIGTANHSTETDGEGKTIHVYEFDFPNREFVITSNSAPQTLGENGIFFFFDLAENFTLTFSLYYRQSSGNTPILVREIPVTFYINNDQGVVHDLSF